MDLKNFTKAELEAWLARRGHPSYRAAQILHWLYPGRTDDFDRMTNLSAALRRELADEFRAPRPACLTRTHAADGTEKYLFGLADGSRIESVLIPSPTRRTLCVSSQAGCGMGCRFCATAALRPARNLTAAEIVGQVWEVRARRPADEAPTNVVFMGMGEPLANYDALLKAVTILTAAWGFALPPRRVTVSTVGLAPQMERLLADTKVNLTVSLGATTDGLRTRLMPVNRRYPLTRLLAACRTAAAGARTRITFAYTLLDGINDAAADAKRLVSLLHGVRAKVNLIPFNDFPGAPFRPAPRKRMLEFRHLLIARGIHASIRESRGQDVQAACGQLAAARPAEPRSPLRVDVPRAPVQMEASPTC